MGAVEALAAASGSAYLATMTVLGIRLLRLAHRNRAWPECWLGIAFLAGGTIGASAEVISARYLYATHPEIAGLLLAAGKVSTAAGLTVYNYFVWRVFRPRDAWAGVLFAALAASGLVALVGFAASGAFGPQLVKDGPWFWVELATRVASPSWLALESFGYYRQMRLRVEIGLAEPLVADRFRLWGIGACTGLAMLAGTITPRFLDADDPLQELNLLVLALMGFACCLAYWLAFFPPAAYRRRIQAAPL